jgi:hypothetical protein
MRKTVGEASSWLIRSLWSRRQPVGFLLGNGFVVDRASIDSRWVPDACCITLDPWNLRSKSQSALVQDQDTIESQDALVGPLASAYSWCTPSATPRAWFWTESERKKSELTAVAAVFHSPRWKGCGTQPGVRYSPPGSAGTKRQLNGNAPV